jgi:predicted membrane channel-forming protein YqfA (hemolysin III family)
VWTLVLTVWEEANLGITSPAPAIAPSFKSSRRLFFIWMGLLQVDTRQALQAGAGLNSVSLLFRLKVALYMVFFNLTFSGRRLKSESKIA